MRPADVDHHAIGVKAVGQKRGIDDKRGAVQCLGRTEQFSLEGVGNHDVIAYFNCKHLIILKS